MYVFTHHNQFFLFGLTNYKQALLVCFIVYYSLSFFSWKWIFDTTLTCSMVFYPSLMEVIRRAPHEFKIACLEVTSRTWKLCQNDIRRHLLTNFIIYIFYKLCFCRTSKDFSLPIIIHSMRDLAIETRMKLVTWRLESRKEKYLLLTPRCAS